MLHNRFGGESLAAPAGNYLPNGASRSYPDACARVAGGEPLVFAKNSSFHVSPSLRERDARILLRRYHACQPGFGL